VLTGVTKLPRTSAFAMSRAISWPLAALGALVAASTIARTAIALHHSTPRYFPDEYLYAALGRSIAHGRLEVNGHAAHFPALLEPILAAPLWRFFPVETAYRLVQFESALAVSLAAIPIYAIARRLGLGSTYALLCAGFGLVAPTIAMSTFTITDFIAYPLALTAIWVALAALTSPRPRTQLLFVVLTGLASLARTEYFVLAPAYLVAAFVLDRRNALRRHAVALLAMAPAAGAVLFAATGYFSVRAHDIPLGVRTVEQIGLQLFMLTFVCGVVLVPGALVGLRRADDRPTRAYASFASAFAVLLILETSLFSADTVRFKERYLFVLPPLVAIAFGVYRRRGSPHRWPVFLISVLLAAVAARLPISAYATGSQRFDSQSLISLAWLQGTLGVSSTSLVAAALITFGAVLATVTAVRPNWRVARIGVLFAVVLAVCLSVVAVHEDFVNTNAVRKNLVAHDPVWIDHSVGGSRVTAIATPLSLASGLLVQMYWNPSINRVLALDDGEPPDVYDTTELGVTQNGTLKGVHGLFLFDEDGTQATFQNARLVKKQVSMALYRSPVAPRLRMLLEGRYADGWLVAGGRLRAWPTTGSAPGTRVRTSFSLTVPKDWPGIGIFRMDGRRWEIRPGTTTRIQCVSRDGRFEQVYRSPSSVFYGSTGYTVTTRMTGAPRVEDVAPGSKVPAGCRTVTG
jgi:hypothetical protein